MRKKMMKMCVLLLSTTLLVGNMSSKIVFATNTTETTVNGETKEEEDPTLSIPIATNEIEGWPQGPKIKEETAVLMEAETGAILYDKQMNEVRYPASTTKIMTTLLALENSKMDEIVTFTETGMEAAYGGSSNIIPVLGEQFSMEDCLYMIMLKSANDVSNQVAEHVGGTLENFIKMMNDRAKELGCKNTHFSNPSGLPDEEHYTTAYDLALIMQEALKNEEFRKIIGTQKVVIPATNKTNGARTYENHHHMILDGDYTYEGTIGGKTGYTDAARSTLVTAVERDNTTLIAVVLKVIGRQCFTDTISLMDYGFDNFSKIDLSAKTKDKLGTIMVPKTAKLEDVKAVEMEEDSLGNTKEYTFKGQKVGEGILQEEVLAKQKQQEEEEKRRIELSKAKEDEKLKKEEAAKAKESKSKVLMIVIIILGILVLFGFILIVVSAVRNRMLRKKRRRQRQRRLRELERQNRRR